MTDVSAGFRPPCWCPCTWAPAWRLHTNLYKFGENVSSHIFYEKNCRDLNLGESLCICTFFLFPDSGLTLLNGFDFLFRSILSGVTLKTSNIINPLLTKLVRSRWHDVGPFSFCEFMDGDGVEVHKHAKKKKPWPMSSHLDLTVGQ